MHAKKSFMHQNVLPCDSDQHRTQYCAQITAKTVFERSVESFREARNLIPQQWNRHFRKVHFPMVQLSACLSACSGSWLWSQPSSKRPHLWPLQPKSRRTLSKTYGGTTCQRHGTATRLFIFLSSNQQSTPAFGLKRIIQYLILVKYRWVKCLQTTTLLFHTHAHKQIILTLTFDNIM